MKRATGREWKPSTTVAAAIVLLSSMPASAQKTTFNPSISLGYSYTDNAEFTDESESATSDTSVTGGIDLPLVRQIDRGAVRLSYNIFRTTYQDQGQLDNTSQRASLSLSRKTRRRSNFRFRVQYTDTDEQQALQLPTEIVPDQPPDSDASLSVTSRTARSTLEGTVDYDWEISQSWHMTAGLGVGDTTFTGGTQVEGRTWYEPSLAVRTTISRRTALGAAYSFRRVELDSSADEDFQSVDVFLDRELTRRIQIELRVGAFSRSSEDGERETHAFGTANLGFNQGITLGPVQLNFAAGVSPGKSEVLEGTALNSTAGLSLSGVRTYPVNWGVNATYTHRSPFESGQETSETVRVGGAVEPSLSRILGLRFYADYSDQTSDDQALDRAYTRAGVTLVVYPLGGKRISGRTRGASG